jgi:hypothetical protein
VSALSPLFDLLPIVRPATTDEQEIWYVEEARVRRTAQLPKLWADHFASVADYWEHKRRHPDTRAGAMVTLYSWTRYIAVAASVVTLNPIMIAMSISDIRQRPGPRRSFL